MRCWCHRVWKAISRPCGHGREIADRPAIARSRRSICVSSSRLAARYTGAARSNLPPRRPPPCRASVCRAFRVSTDRANSPARPPRFGAHRPEAHRHAAVGDFDRCTQMPGRDESLDEYLAGCLRDVVGGSHKREQAQLRRKSSRHQRAGQCCPARLHFRTINNRPAGRMATAAKTLPHSASTIARHLKLRSFQCFNSFL